MRDRRWLLVLAMGLAGALPAAAQDSAADQTAPILRGAPPAPTTKATPPATSRLSPWNLRPAPPRPDPNLQSPSLRTPTAPRLEGLSAAPMGGAACRTACAANLYVCQGADAGDHCQQSWNACVLACPTASGAL
jgi:hypothetical protein